MEIGTIVIIIVIILFYGRLYLLNRGKRRRDQQEMVRRMKMGKKAPPFQQREWGFTSFTVKSWWIIVPGIVLMLAGLAINTESLLPQYRTYWWVPVAIGGLLFMFGFE